VADLTLRDLEGTGVLHGINLAVADGEFVVFVGPSGCGKSTTLRLIAGLEKVTSGTIEIGGRLVNDLKPEDRGIAMVFQNYAIYPHMPVGKSIGFGLRGSNAPRAEKQKRIDEAGGRTPPEVGEAVRLGALSENTHVFDAGTGEAPAWSRGRRSSLPSGTRPRRRSSPTWPSPGDTGRSRSRPILLSANARIRLSAGGSRA
jgi:ABC-type glutathione transport system ATPase component